MYTFLMIYGIHLFLCNACTLQIGNVDILYGIWNYSSWKWGLKSTSCIFITTFKKAMREKRGKKLVQIGSETGVYC